VPRLKYRNPVPQDDAIEEVHHGGHSTDNPQRESGSTIPDMRLSTSQSHDQGANDSPPKSPMPPSVMSPSKPPPKKTSSLFGGLFGVKEPTQLALTQMSAQLTAQHGSTSANKVPNVSMEKMPQHVPKVNAKWDGIPDAIKQREKRERERTRAGKRRSLTSSTLKSHSSERIVRASNSRSSDHSGTSQDSRARSVTSGSRKHNSYAPNPHRFYAQSVNSSGDLAAQQRPEESSRPSSMSSPPPSVTSTSSKSLANVNVSADRIPPPPKVPAHLLGTSSNCKDAYQARVSSAPPVESLPDHTKSPALTPRECSPVTPVQQGHELASPITVQGPTLQRNRVPPAASGSDVLPLPITTKKKASAASNAAFLAGEAQEFRLPDDESIRSYRSVPSDAVQRVIAVEKRPDSSRERLGLRSSMVVKEDIPWGQVHADRYYRPPSADDRTNAQLKPKSTMSKAWGSLLKREL